MLRKDKLIPNREHLDTIIQQSQICHLACCLDDQPYVIPISFGYDGKTIYFHSAKKGKKIEILSHNSQVCLAFESHVKLVEDADKACDWSFDFASVVVIGIAKPIENPQEKIYGLNQIMLHYSGKSWNIPEMEVNKTTVWAVLIQEITGKGNQFT